MLLMHSFASALTPVKILNPDASATCDTLLRSVATIREEIKSLARCVDQRAPKADVTYVRATAV